MNAFHHLFLVVVWAGFFSCHVMPVSAPFGNNSINKRDPFLLAPSPLNGTTKLPPPPPPSKSIGSFRTDESIFGTKYISTGLLQEFKKLIGIHHEDFPVTCCVNDTFAKEVDVVFRHFMGINSSEPLLGISHETIISIAEKVQVNQPFIVRTPTTAHSIQNFLAKLSNGTSKFFYEYRWIGGSIINETIGNTFQSYLTSICRKMDIHYSDGRKETISWEIISTRDGFLLIIFPSEHASPLCGGDSLFFKDHPLLSQKLLFMDKTRPTRAWYSFFLKFLTVLDENIDEKDINSGRSSPLIMHITASSPYYSEFKEFNNMGRFLIRPYSSGEQRLQATKEFEHSLAAYNNFGFVLLSIASLASSTIVVIATKNGSRQIELAIAAVEAIAVSFFLIVITYVLVVFVRADDIFVMKNVSRRIRLTTLHTHGRIDVSALHRKLAISVTKSLNWPWMLVLAEICAVFAMMAVLFNLVRLFQKRSDEAYTDDEDVLIIELRTNEDIEEHSSDSL